MKVDETIDKYITRLCIKGLRQKQGFDLVIIYSSVTRITFILMIILLIVISDLQLHQIHVKTFLLNKELEEETYIEQPGSFMIPGKLKKLCEHTMD